MKKFLTVLLVIAVMFTFSFSSAFAATEYTLDQYNQVLNAEKELQVGYLANAKTMAVNAYTYDADGFTSITGGHYMKAAVEAAADAAIAALTTEMTTAINNALNGTFPTELAPDKTVVSDVTFGCLDASGMQAKIAAQTAVLNKTQAPLTKTFVEGKLAKVKSTDYDDATAVPAYGNLTAKAYVDELAATAKSAIAAAAAKTSDDEKISGYYAALASFTDAVAPIPTKLDQDIEAAEAAKNVDTAVAYHVAQLTAALTPVFNMADTYPKTNFNPASPTDYAAAKFYVAKSGAKKATLFGVEIADINSITKAEAYAVNNAAAAMVQDTAKVLKAYAGTNTSKLTNYFYYGYYIGQLQELVAVADKYQAVLDVAADMKQEYQAGVKQYDDANVDAAAKKAEELVYANLGAWSDPEDYIEKAAYELDINLSAATSELESFEKAVLEAKAKFIPTAVTTGANKTAEEDMAYVAALYYDSTAYGKIKDETSFKLSKAKSYVEIDQIMADAKAELAKLELAADHDKVEAARTQYINAFAAYANQQYALLDTTKYAGSQLSDIIDDAAEAMNEATTVDAVKAAYDEAIKNFALKTDEELTADSKAVVEKVNKLPYTSSLTSADKAAVEDAYEALAAYAETPGADLGAISSTVSLLKEKLNKIYTMEAKALEDKADALAEKLEKLPSGDAAYPIILACEDEARAIAEEAKALFEVVDDNEVLTNTQKEDIFDAMTSAGNVYQFVEMGQIELIKAQHAATLLVKAAKEGATEEEVAEAMEAYNALPEAYQLYVKEAPQTAAALATVKDKQAAAGKAEEEQAKAEKAANDAYVKGVCENVTLKFNGKKTSSGKTAFYFGEKGSAKLQKLEDLGYVLEFKYYKAESKTKPTAPKCNTYMSTSKGKKTSDNGYQMIPTKGTKDKYYAYAAQINVYDAEDNLIATIDKSQVNFGWAKWTGKTVK